MAVTIERIERESGPTDYTDFYRTGPGTVAGRWLRTFWHPVYIGADLPIAYPKPLKIMDEQLTLYRGESGAAHAVGFRCGHRRTQLSNGWIEGENIRCFFHGWMYDPSGQCIDQPAEPEPFCAEINVGSYPVEEYLGLIWVYLGGGAPAPLPRYPDYDKVDTVLETKLRAGNWYNHLGFDTAHSAFVHARGRDASQRGRIHLPRVEETEWGLSPVVEPGERTRHVGHHGIPNISQHIRFEENGQPDVLRWVVPVDDEHNRDFSVFRIGDEANRRHQEARASSYTETSDRAAELTQRILVGELRIEDVERAEQQATITNVQDSIAQVGMGPISERQYDRLGAADAGLTLRKQIFERELRALAEGRPLKQWARSERFYRENPPH